MGTKAVFKIAGYNDKIVGMCSDGTPENLITIAFACWKIAKNLRVITKWKKQDKATIELVLNELVKENKDWLFLDDPRNPVWVSYSAEMKIRDGVLIQFEGYFEYETRGFVNVSQRSATERNK